MSKGRIALSAGQAASAVASFEQLRQAHPQDPQVRLWLSKACSAAGLGSESLAEARAAAELDPASAEVLAQWAEAARRSDSLEEAVEAARKLTDLTPSDGPAWLALGELLDRTDSPTQAREAVARAVAVGRKNAGLLRQGAELLARLEDAGAAERLLESAARLHPEDPQGWVGLAEFQDRCGKPEAASESWLHAARLQPATEGASRRAAHALAKAGRPDEGYAVLQAAWEASPSDATLRLDLAESLIERGQPEQALRLLQDVPHAVDLPPVQRGRAGVLLSRIGEMESGLRLAREAADADTESAELWTGLAEVWLRANLPAESLPCLDHAVRLAGRSLTAYALLVHAHLSRGDAMSAWDALRAASSERPMSLEEARSVAAAHLRLGEWQAALNTVEDYGEASHDASALIAAAEILLRMNDAWWLYGEIAGATRHAPAFSREDLRVRTEEAVAALRLADGDPRRRLILARWQASIEPNEKSAVELEEAARAAGNPPAALEGLAISLIRMAAAQDAFRIVQRLAPSALDGAWQPVLAGLCHLRLGNLDWAVQAFQAATSDAALAPLARALASTVEAAPGDGAQAIASLNDAVAAWPNEATWHLQLANLYLEREEFDSALPHLQHAADLDPENGDAWLALARALREAGHPDEAQQAYEQVVRLLPGLGLVWKEAGAIALGRGDFERAATWFARAQAVSPSDVEALVGAARADLGLGRTRQARQKAETALEQSPESPLALESLAEVMAADGEVDNAISMLERASAQSDRPGAIRAGRARLLMNHGRGDQAVVDLKKALEVDGDEALWAALADALASLGRFDEALEAGGEAVRIAPRNASYRVRMGRISRQAGYLDRALDELTQAESLAQPTADLSMEQGQVFEERREFERALQAYQRAVELNPGLAQAYLRAGLVYRSLKAYPQAARMFKHAVELAPQDASALHQLAAVHALQLVHGGFHPTAVTT
jgi:tetratricopeptide (TPR) repeat protein